MIPFHFQFQPQPQRGRGKPTGGRRRALEVRRGVAGGPRGADGWRRRAQALVRAASGVGARPSLPAVPRRRGSCVPARGGGAGATRAGGVSGGNGRDEIDRGGVGPSGLPWAGPWLYGK